MAELSRCRFPPYRGMHPQGVRGLGNHIIQNPFVSNFNGHFPFSPHTPRFPINQQVIHPCRFSIPSDNSSNPFTNNLANKSNQMAHFKNPRFSSPIRGHPFPPKSFNYGNVPPFINNQNGDSKICYDNIQQRSLKKSVKKNGPCKKLEPFFCEACDRGWKNVEALENHMSQHRTCGIDGCQLSAHPKIIEKHIQQQHVTGLYKRITSSYKPEDIEKWISERKSQFPTKENIERKKAKQAEMVSRGENMPQNNRNRFSNFSGRKRDHSFFDKRRRGKKRTRQNNRTNFNNNNKNETKSTNGVHEPTDETSKVFKMVNSLEDDWRGGLPQFPGTAAFLDIKKEIVEEEEQQISDDEWQNDNVTSPRTVPPLSQAFLNLCGYGSTDEEDELPTKKIKENNFNQEHKTNEVVQKCSLSENTVNENIKLSNTHIELYLDMGPEEAPIQHEDEQHDYNGKVNKIDEKVHNNHKSKENAPEKMPENVVQNKIEKVVKRNVPYNTRFIQRRRRHTLLEKLLRNEITHERNVILQCIRFIVQNNFFHEK